MTRYFTTDGNEFVAATDADLVEQMRKASSTPSENSAEFMAKIAERIKEESGRVIATDTAEAFVTALVDAGYVEEKEEEVND